MDLKRGQFELSATSEDADLWEYLGNMGYTQVAGRLCKVPEAAAVQHGHEVGCLKHQWNPGFHYGRENLGNHHPLRSYHEYPDPNCPRQTGYDWDHSPWDDSGQLAVTDIEA